MVTGDQMYYPVLSIPGAAHSFAESTRLAAVFAGAVLTARFYWMIVLLWTLALNLLSRLGWTRYVCFVVTRRLLGIQQALSLFAPTSWNMLHEEMKIYAGYLRFVPLLSLLGIRASLGSDHPFFNWSALGSLLGSLLVEILEDCIVVQARRWDQCQSWAREPLSPKETQVVQSSFAGAAADGSYRFCHLAEGQTQRQHQSKTAAMLAKGCHKRNIWN